MSLVVLVVVCALLFSLGGEVTDRVVVTALLNLVLVVSLYVFCGNSGVFSFGHMGFALIGAYTAGILTIPGEQKAVLLPELPGFLSELTFGPFVATLAGACVAMLVGAIIAVPLMRLSGIAAALASFALLMIILVIASNWEQVTNGASGMAGVPATTDMSDALLWALAAIAVAYGFQSTRWGLRLRGSREDEIAARASGVGVVAERRAAWVVSAFFTGAGGALYAQFLGSFNPSAFDATQAFPIIAMLVVGGLTSLAGAVVGALVISVISEVLRRTEEQTLFALVPDFIARPGLQEVGIALIMLVILIRRPDGLLGGREVMWPRVLNRQSSARDRARSRHS